ncbi:hypothetical protein KI387_028105, partial [Taxus chinensis]
MPSVLIPVKELVRICREEGVDQVFVDGAHAIGNVDIDMQDIGADFYTSNLHKWFFCPPSVAFLYCRHSFHSNAHHPIVSHLFGNGLPAESAWVGTRDYSAQLCVPSALEFTKKFQGGIEAIRRKNHEKVVAMGEMLADAWGTLVGDFARVGLIHGDGCFAKPVWRGFKSKGRILFIKQVTKNLLHLQRMLS